MEFGSRCRGRAGGRRGASARRRFGQSGGGGIGADRAHDDGAAGGRRSPLHRPAERPGQDSDPGRQDPGRAVPRPHRPDHPAVAAVRREGPARARVPSGLRQQRQVLRRLQRADPLEGRPGQALLVVAHQRDRGVHGLRGRSRRGGPEQRAPDLGDRLAAVQSRRPLDRLRSGRLFLRLDRRRRLRQRLGHRPQCPHGQRPGPALAARQDPQDRGQWVLGRQQLRHPGR